jgi:ribonucleoside-diphosphate reductase alpha chain
MSLVSSSVKRREGSGGPGGNEGGLAIPRVFSHPDEHPFEQIAWEKRTAKISGDKGKVVFEQQDVEVPADWSQLATNVAASKYFYGDRDKPERERSVRQLVERVCRTIADWGKEDGLFASDEDGERFYLELTYLCVNQHAAFNSPVWFNVGLYHCYGVEGSQGNWNWDQAAGAPARAMKGYEHPQASACFIQSVEDSIEDIMRLASAEAMLFKYGSGTGTDLSTLRSSQEKLAGGGTPSGPLSFMRVYDQVAAVIKSGGKTRRAAKMQSLRCDHPDIKDFIECKMREERKAWALIEQGYDGSFNGDAYSSVMFQNSNLSVRLTDEFLQAALDGGTWQTRAVTTKEPAGQFPAAELLRLIAEGTHVCGDPGVQYHTTINRWNTCPQSGEICASNPCSEYMFLNDSACNLASLNLVKFRQADGSLDVARFQAAARLLVIAQEILVDHGSYPSAKICRNSHEFRPLGLGYANLGALLMSVGLPYDSDAGRGLAAAVTAILTGTAYAASAELAGRVGAFPQFFKNRSAMLKVIAAHRSAVDAIPERHAPAALRKAAAEAWDRALAMGGKNGFRNAQVTVLAPTGTIGFLMDCDTTGIEPDIALVKYKQLAGGGMLKMVNNTVPLALKHMGYGEEAVSEIIDHIDRHDTIEGAPGLREEHLPVFDCAFRPAKGERSIHHMGHIRMMSAVQPFISGAISKTVNVPKETTIDEIRGIYVEGWKQGLKAVAVYRDGSKRTQPLNVVRKKDDAPAAMAQPAAAAPSLPNRHRLPATRPSITHKFDVANHEGYLNVGLYEDGTPGELFITMSKEGSTVGGMMDAFATAISLCLQYGVPLEALVKKFTHQRFEPSGMTANRDIPFAKSIVDYVFRWLGLTFLEEYRKAHLPKTAEPAGAGEPSRTGGVLSSSAVSEVKDGVPSVPDDAGRAPGKEGQSPVGVLFRERLMGGMSSPASAPAGVYQPAKLPAAEAPLAAARTERWNWQTWRSQEDAPPCLECGEIMVRNGSCYKCPNCGSTSGCS